MSPLPPPGTDTTGPIYKDGLFSRVTAIHFPQFGVKDPVFVAGDYAGHASSTNIKGQWTPIGGLSFSPGALRGYIYGSAFHLFDQTPIFLLVGATFITQPFSSFYEGIIMASKDAVRWAEVYRLKGIPYEGEIVTDPDGFHPHVEGQYSSATIHSVAWDGEAFWAGGQVFDYVTRTNNISRTFSDVLLVSDDGLTWSEAARRSVDDVAGEILPTTGLMCEHCITPFTDSFGNPVPNGVWGEAIQAKVKIGPVSPPSVDYTGVDTRSTSSLVMPIGTNGLVRIINEAIRIEKIVDTGIGGVMGVAYSKGIWWAVGDNIPNDLSMSGGPQVVYSVDGGDTWTQADYRGDIVMTVSGAS